MNTERKRRIYELDLLRGIFIIIIIIDHLQFWPSPFTYLTGEGRLWVSAAEGFFLISGLLIGYIRAYKGQYTPLRIIAKKLLKRAGMLYAWGVGLTLLITGYVLLVGLNNHPLLPALPASEQLATPWVFLWNVISTNYFNSWVYFLRLYAIMLAVTPLFLWMIRKGYWRVIPFISIGCYAISWVFPEGALQWQVLFFGAALFGYKLESIADWLHARPIIKKLLLSSLIAFTATTFVLSYFFVHGWQDIDRGHTLMDRSTYDSLRQLIDPWFSSNPMAIGRLLLSFIWFGGILAVVHLLRKPFLRYGKWLLVPLGDRSLSAYCLQAVLLVVVVVVIPHGSYWYNTLVTILAVLGIWWLLKQPIIEKILPR